MGHSSFILKEITQFDLQFKTIFATIKKSGTFAQILQILIKLSYYVE